MALTWFRVGLSKSPMTGETIRRSSCCALRGFSSSWPKSIVIGEAYLFPTKPGKSQIILCRQKSSARTKAGSTACLGSCSSSQLKVGKGPSQSYRRVNPQGEKASPGFWTAPLSGLLLRWVAFWGVLVTGLSWALTMLLVTRTALLAGGGNCLAENRGVPKQQLGNHSTAREQYGWAALTSHAWIAAKCPSKHPIFHFHFCFQSFSTPLCLTYFCLAVSASPFFPSYLASTCFLFFFSYASLLLFFKNCCSGFSPPALGDFHPSWVLSKTTSSTTTTNLVGEFYPWTSFSGCYATEKAIFGQEAVRLSSCTLPGEVWKLNLCHSSTSC